MTREETTKFLSDLAEKHINPRNDPRIYWAREVTFDYATTHAVRVDYMKFKPVNNTVSGIEKGDFYCYEVKSSVEDFRSKNGHNFIGDYNYYVMPHDVFTKIKTEIPYKVGVYCPCGNELKSVKKAVRADRERPVSEMLLMMFRSATRDMVRIWAKEGEEMYTVCQKCGKKLTDPESMRRGYGPECWSQISGISTADSGGPVNEAELPGQMTIFDFPDAIPDGGQNE